MATGQSIRAMGSHARAVPTLFQGTTLICSPSPLSLHALDRKGL